MNTVAKVDEPIVSIRGLDKQLTTEAYGIAVRKDEPQLKAAFNTALAKIKADGTYAAIVKKWFGATAQ